MKIIVRVAALAAVALALHSPRVVFAQPHDGAAGPPVANDPGAAATATPEAEKIKVHTVTGDEGRLQIIRPEGDPKNAPTIVVIPGLGCQPQDYMQLTFMLRARGYNVALFDEGATDEKAGNQDMEAELWEKRLVSAMSVYEKANKDPQSDLYESTNFDRLGIIGHSLGGSVATIAAARDSRFKALAVFGPGGKDQGFLTEARDVKAATIAIDGSLDRVTPPEKAGAVVVDRSASPYKAHVIIKGGAHPNAPADYNADYIRDYGRFFMTPTPFWPFFKWDYGFQILKDIKPMPGDEQRGIAFAFLGPWLDRFVAGKTDADGWTTGLRGKIGAEKDILTKSEFSDAARADGKPPTSVAATVRGVRSRTAGLANIIERDMAHDRDGER